MNAAHIIALILAIGFTVSAFLFYKKHRRFSFTLFCFAFVALMIGSLKVIQIGFSTEQALCWLFGLMCFIASVYLFADKDKFSFGMVVFLISIAAFFCGLSSVQTFLKTGMMMRVLNSLDEYSKKIDTFQTNVFDMNEYLTKQQNKLTTNQNGLTTAFKDIQRQQTELASQQIILSNEVLILAAWSNHLVKVENNISSQQEKLSDVTYWVQNLYSNMVNVTYSFRDTNNLRFQPVPLNHNDWILRTDYMPINGSLEVYLNDLLLGTTTRLNLPQRENITKNIYVGLLLNYDTNQITFTVRYVADSRKTNIYKRMPNNSELTLKADGKYELPHVEDFKQ